MKKLFFILALALLAGGAFPRASFARVTQDAAPRWITVTPDLFPINATTRNEAPWTDGWMIVLHAEDGRSGLIATDITCNTDCTVAPITPVFSFATLDGYMTAANSFATLTCGASLHKNAGHLCWIDFALSPISDPSNYNYDTPSWVFTQAWATTVGSAVEDAVFCSGYPNFGSPAPASAIANVNTSNCNGAACSPTTLATGIPAQWEAPYLAFLKSWYSQFFSYLATSSYVSQIMYVNATISIGEENKGFCHTFSGVAGTGLESIVPPPWTHTDAGIQSAFHGALGSFFAYAAGLRSNLGLKFALIARFAMPTDLSSAGGSTDPSWALTEASFATLYSHTGVGSNGSKNSDPGDGGSDLINIVGATVNCLTPANSPPCPSTNYPNAVASVLGKVDYIIQQTGNVTDPAGGAGHVLDASLSGTGTQPDTMWQFLTLIGSVGVNIAELNGKDVQCIGNISPLPPCGPGTGYNAAIQPAYQGAAQAWAQGQIPIKH